MTEGQLADARKREATIRKARMAALEGPEDLVEPAPANLIRFPFERRSDHQWSVIGLGAPPEQIEKHHAAMVDLGRDECGHPGCWACYPARERGLSSSAPYSWPQPIHRAFAVKVACYTARE